MRILQYSWWKNKSTGVVFLVVAKIGDNLLLLNIYSDETKVFSEKALRKHIENGLVKQMRSDGTEG